MNPVTRWVSRALGLDDAYSGWLRGGLEDDLTDAGPDWQEEYRRAMAHPERSSITMDCVGFLRKQSVAIPFVLERRAGEDDWRPVMDSPVVKLLKPTIGPSIMATSLWGNAYWRMMLSNGGRPLELMYLHPGAVQPKKVAGRIAAYEYTPPTGRIEVIPSRRGAPSPIRRRPDLSHVGVSPPPGCPLRQPRCGRDDLHEGRTRQRPRRSPGSAHGEFRRQGSQAQ